MYLVIVGLTVVEIKCCSLVGKIGRRVSLEKELVKEAEEGEGEEKEISERKDRARKISIKESIRKQERHEGD